jgi:hypothetical protein
MAQDLLSATSTAHRDQPSLCYGSASVGHPPWSGGELASCSGSPAGGGPADGLLGVTGTNVRSETGPTLRLRRASFVLALLGEDEARK